MAVNIGQIMASMGLDTTRFNQSLQRVQGDLRRTGQKMQKMGQQLSLAVSLPLTLMGGQAIRTFANFEQAMNQVNAVSGATGEQMAQLTGLARELGSTTKFSATQAAEGMNFLSMAGFEVNEVMDALPSTLNLAAAGNMQLGESADIVSNIMQGFGRQAEDTSEVVDVLTKTFTSSNTDLQQLGQAMSFVAPVAKGFGQSIEETSAAIGFLSDAGIQATRAGTGLRRVLSLLAERSDEVGVKVFDAQGEMRSFADILEDIEKQGMSSAEIMRVFGIRGGPIMQILLSRGADALREFTGELENSGGTAERVAETQMQGLMGAWIELRSALQELMISFIEPFSEMLEGLVDNVKNLTQWLGNLSEGTRTWIVILGGVAAAAGPVLTVLGFMVSNIGSLIPLIRGLWIVMSAHPIGALVTAISMLLVPAIIQIISNFNKAKESAEDFMTSIENLSVAQQQAKLSEELQRINAEIEKQEEVLKKSSTATDLKRIAEQKLIRLKEKREQLDKKWLELTSKVHKEEKAQKETQKELMEARKLAAELANQAQNSTNQAVVNANKALREQLRLSRELAQVGKQGTLDMSVFETGEMEQATSKTIRMVDDTVNIINTRFHEGMKTVGQLGNVFNGMQNVIQSSLESSKGFLDAFGKFFADFIKGLIMKLTAAIVATLILAIALQAITGGAAGGFGATIGKVAEAFGTGGIFNLVGLQEGGVVTEPGDFVVGEKGPEVVSLNKGDAVTPIGAAGAGGKVEIRPKMMRIGDEIFLAFEEWKRKKDNTF